MICENCLTLEATGHRAAGSRRIAVCPGCANIYDERARSWTEGQRANAIEEVHLRNARSPATTTVERERRVL